MTHQAQTREVVQILYCFSTIQVSIYNEDFTFFDTSWVWYLTVVLILSFGSAAQLWSLMWVNSSCKSMHCHLLCFETNEMLYFVAKNHPNPPGSKTESMLYKCFFNWEC